MITEAIKEKLLRPGIEIIEVSAENAGIAFIWIGTTFVCKIKILMLEGMSA